MTAAILENRDFLADLYAGPFRGHAIIMEPESPASEDWSPGDFSCSDRPLSEWLPVLLQCYENRLQWHMACDDDSVPFVKLRTGTQLFAAAFGCPVHVYPDSPPIALPLVNTAEEADALELPDMDHPPFNRVFEMAQRVRERVGPEVPIGVPDIQSPFDIAALVWRKEEFLVATLEHPDAVKRLVDKCRRLLIAFFDRFLREAGECTLNHCPNAWVPAELGIGASEDEVGSLSTSMFEEFCLPGLADLSQRYGGLFMHCCAAADHQYPGFRKIPRLRGINRVFQEPGPGPAIETFSGETVFMVAWTPEEQVYDMLDLARPDTRFLFNMPGQPLDESRQTYERIRARCPRA